MKRSTIYEYGIVHAVGAFAYIVGISTFFAYGTPILGGTPEFFAPMFMLTLFVISAAVMAMVVFGRPVMWYLDGKKSEAVILALSTVVALALIGAILFTILALTADPTAAPTVID